MNKGDATTGAGKNYAWRRRPRAYKPKVRTGCKTCKYAARTNSWGRRTLGNDADGLLRIRRIKCDEEKPACLKCRSTGRQCDGYDKVQTRTPTPQTDDQSPARLGSSLRTPSPPGTSPNYSELAALQFFQTRTIAQLSGYFASELWNRYVLQLSLLEPSIYYATTALGRLHRWYAYEEPASSLNPDAFIFRQYNKAIYHLVHPTKPLSKSVVLVACYVLSSIEALYGDYRSSFQYVSSGIRLLCEPDSVTPHTYPPRTPTGLYSFEEKQIEESLLIHFSQLDLQASTFDPEWVPSMTDADISPTDLNISISSSEEARALLTPALLQVMAHKRHGEKVADQQTADGHIVRSRLGGYLRQWSNAVETWLMRDRGVLTQRQWEGSLSLRVLCLTGYIMLAAPGSAEEIIYDSLLDEFRSIAELASALVPLQEDDHISPSIHMKPASYQVCI